MTDHAALLRELAVPRLVGCPNHARVRAALTRELEGRGFVVMEHRCPAWPDRLWAVSLAGTGLALLCLGVLVFALGLRTSATARYALALLAGGGAGASALAIRYWLRLPPARDGAVNLVAVRSTSRVSAWLTAHYDSKGQRISMATRLAAVVLSLLGYVGLLGLVVVVVVGSWTPLWGLLALPGVFGGLLLSLNAPTNTSPGAVDNASALVTVLATVDALPSDAPVGVIFPDAEEYGLLGAAALARERAHLLAGTAVVNFDGIDDRGGVTALVHRAGPIVDAVAAGLGARRARWLPILVDGIAFASVARECVTIMRGDWETARVVHTPRDTADRLTLDGMRGVARSVAAVLARVDGGGLGP